MSYADYKFVTNCQDIIENGISDESFEVRPRWDDGTPAHTKKKLYVMDRYQLTQDSIPVMTLRKTGFKNAIDEILWIYQKNSNKIADLRSHIWDSWDIGDGTIGRAYGYQIGRLHYHHKYTHGEKLDEYPSAIVQDDGVYMTQIDGVIWDLKNNPGSRSIMSNMYCHQDLHAMGLRPCAYSMTYNVTKDEDGNMVLNGMLNQRSQDMLTANNWNVVQYSVLMHMIAQVCGMKVGQFVHVVADMHIYDRHIPIVIEMITRYHSHILQHGLSYDFPYPNPKFWINPEIRNFYDFTVDDFKLIDYQYLDFAYRIPVAV